jgi:hypothetical protein
MLLPAFALSCKHKQALATAAAAGTAAGAAAEGTAAVQGLT